MRKIILFIFVTILFSSCNKDESGIRMPKLIAYGTDYSKDAYTFNEQGKIENVFREYEDGDSYLEYTYNYDTQGRLVSIYSWSGNDNAFVTNCIYNGNTVNFEFYEYFDGEMYPVTDREIIFTINDYGQIIESKAKYYDFYGSLLIIESYSEWANGNIISDKTYSNFTKKSGVFDPSIYSKPLSLKSLNNVEVNEELTLVIESNYSYDNKINPYYTIGNFDHSLTKNNVISREVIHHGDSWSGNEFYYSYEYNALGQPKNREDDGFTVKYFYSVDM